MAVEHLTNLSKTTSSPIAAGTVEDLTAAYYTSGWQADDAVIKILASVNKPDDWDAVSIAIQAVYLPWAEESARYLQKIADQSGYPGGSITTAKAVSYRIEINEGPGSGIKILNKPIPQAFRESIGCAEQNLYARSAQLVGDKDPRQHEFTVQLRAFDSSKSGAKAGIAALVALCTALLKKSIRGGLIICGEINLGGSIEPIHNAVNITEIAVEKGAMSLLMRVSCRKQLIDLSDEMATKIDIQFYSDARDALLKAILEFIIRSCLKKKARSRIVTLL